MRDRINQKLRTIRCAIYTRKSSEEGLEQEFNSLHAQREACEAYVASQRHEGWRTLATSYDDGGFSGGSMERPGLKRLLSDIHAELIDTVVVYKVDRLTRSLTDFARMVEVFDTKGVSFVSVTQSFNTTSSMGRLTLNVLLSFAQFEREVTGERIRDKIAASKKKGLWMGGFVPMGYAADGRTLRIVDEEAAIIRDIFERFLILGGIRRLKEELDRKHVVTRAFKSASNREWGARPFSLGHLRAILANPIYAGEIAHRGERFKAQHQAIVAPETFEAVQQRLSAGKQEGRVRANAKDANLLSRLLFDEAGNGLIGSHTTKAGRRYRYYVTRPEVAEALRIPAGEIEPLVLRTLTTKLVDRSWLMATLMKDEASPDSIAQRASEAARLASELQQPTGPSQRQALPRLLERITIRRDGLSLMLTRDALGSVAIGERDQSKGRNDGPATTIEVAGRFVRRGQTLHLMVPPNEGADLSAPLDKSLIKALSRAVTWYDDLTTGRAGSMREIAAQEGVSERYVAQLLRLAFLKPKLVEAYLEGNAALSITGADIAPGIALPLDWNRQAALVM